jgi:hypothetical protein
MRYKTKVRLISLHLSDSATYTHQKGRIVRKNNTEPCAALLVMSIVKTLNHKSRGVGNSLRLELEAERI